MGANIDLSMSRGNSFFEAQQKTLPLRHLGAGPNT